MSELVVTTKEVLEKAKSDDVLCFRAKEKLADDLKKSKSVAIAGAAVLAAVTAAFGLAPVTGGFLFGVSAGVTELTGLEIAAIIVAASLGIALIAAIFKGYDEILYKSNELVLRRKQK